MPSPDRRARSGRQCVLPHYCGRGDPSQRVDPRQASMSVRGAAMPLGLGWARQLVPSVAAQQRIAHPDSARSLELLAPRSRV